MINPNMKARISQLHKTEAEWNALPNFVPFSGELIIYTPDENYGYSRLKVGDGKKSLQELPFFIDSAITYHMQNILLNEVIDAGRITASKK